MRKNLQQLFDEFMYECEFVKKVRPDTLRGYASTFNLFTKLMPSASIESITPNSITQFFKILQDRKRIIGKGVVKTGIKKSTVATYWGKLHSFFKWLELKGYCRTDPFRQLFYPSVQYTDKRFLKKEEIEKIITAIHSHHDNNLFILKRNLTIFYILLFCGLRKEELLSLQIRDIDLEKKILTVRRDTSKSDITRQLPLHSTVILFLKDYLNARKQYTTPYIFASSRYDCQLTNEGLRHIVQKIKKYSKVPFFLHQFRHTFAVNFLSSSNNIAKLKQLMGHKSIISTMVYLRCLPITAFRGDIENMSVDNLI